MLAAGMGYRYPLAALMIDCFGRSGGRAPEHLTHSGERTANEMPQKNNAGGPHLSRRRHFYKEQARGSRKWRRDRGDPLGSHRLRKVIAVQGPRRRRAWKIVFCMNAAIAQSRPRVDRVNKTKNREDGRKRASALLPQKNDRRQGAGANTLAKF